MMNKREAIKAMLEGEEVYHEHFDPGIKYIYISPNGKILTDTGRYFDINSFISTGWKRRHKVRDIMCYKHTLAVEGPETKSVFTFISHDSEVEVAVGSEPIYKGD